MKKITKSILIAAYLLLGFKLNGAFAEFGYKPNLLFSAELNGSEQVPSVTTNAKGVASFMLNPTQDTLCVNVSFTGLSGSAIEMHIHDGFKGSNGPDIVDLSASIVGNRASTIVTGTALSAIKPKLFVGGLYLNVHTVANPDGEIRGQIELETDYSYFSNLNGSQQVPAVTTNAGGICQFRLSKNDSSLEFDGAFYGLGTITEVHLHQGAPGTNGPVVADLTSLVTSYTTGSSITGSINPKNILTDLKAGNIYMNIHTAAHPNGELRGQLIYKNGTIDVYVQLFSQVINGGQAGPGFGIGIIDINKTMDTLWYDISIDTLSSSVTVAAFSNGTTTMYSIPSSNINGHRITGKITGSSLNYALINGLLTEDIILDIKTINHPLGEYAGNSQPETRQGYTFSLDGNQQVPAVNTTATGSGFASIDHDYTNAYVAYTYSGLTATEVHLHAGKQGATGQVLVDLASLNMNDGGSGFIMIDTIAEAFINDSVYMNIHSTNHASGEIRGQVWEGKGCYTNITTSIYDSPETENGLTIYPNPSFGTFNVQVKSNTNETANIKVCDVLGKEVFSENFQLTKGNNQTTLSLGNLDGGVFIIKILADNLTLTKRVVKN